MSNGDQNQDHWCFAWPQTGPDTEGQTRAGLVKGAKWQPGDVITVSFLDGDRGVQDKVQAAAKQWTGPQMANLTLTFRRDTTDTLIRISFRNKGSWSTIGTTCRLVPKGQPTMNYGWLTPGISDKDLNEVVFHEFGHALGLIHEHQSPGGKIKWNKDAIYRELSGPPNSWSREVIDRNMFQPYDAKETNFTKLDTKSIMMYPIPKSWTTDGSSVGTNSVLSDTDKKFIRQQYPQ